MGGVLPVGGVLPGGVCFPGGFFPGGVCVLPRGASRGVCLPGGCFPGGLVSKHALRQTPPVNRMTDRCKNITFATSLGTVKINNMLFEK